MVSMYGLVEIIKLYKLMPHGHPFWGWSLQYAGQILDQEEKSLQEDFKNSIR